MMTRKSTLFLIFLFICAYNYAQTKSYTATVVDQKTNQPLPYATVQTEVNNGLITNEEGKFSLSVDYIQRLTDSISITSLGYEERKLAKEQLTDSIIYLNPKSIELSQVFLSDQQLTAEEIIEKVKENLVNNYKNKNSSVQKLFLRESDFTQIEHLDVDHKKSTIKELNEKFIDSVVSIIPRKSSFYTEILGDYYVSDDANKLAIVKAAELYDKANDGSMETMSNRIENIFKDNVKRSSYLKIKSGWLPGFKIPVDSILQEEKPKPEKVDSLKKKSDNFFKYRKSTIKELFTDFFFDEDHKLNFLDKSNRYEFKVDDYTTIDGNIAYVLNFEPKGNQDFKGTLYVNTQDFAIMRLDYQNVKRLRNIKLLGFHYQEKDYKGTLLYGKTENDKYRLKYFERTERNYIGVDRPLKIIEKNKVVKGRNKQNELSVNVDVGVFEVTKYEMVVFESQSTNKEKFQELKENKTVKPTYLSSYNPEFWSGYSIIEPNNAIKQFKTIEEQQTL